MTNENRQPKGQPTGGQFAHKTYTDADVVLATQRAESALSASREWSRRAVLASAQALAVEILSQYPDAAYLDLHESDSRYSAFYAGQIVDADGETLVAAEDLDGWQDAVGEFPEERPSDVHVADGQVRIEEDARFGWLTTSGVDDADGRVDLRAAAEIEL